MKRKWWIVGGLVLVELLICGIIVLTLWTGRGTFGGVRFFYVTDTHVEEMVEGTFAVDGPAALSLDAEFGDVTVIGSDGDDVEVTAWLNLWGSDEQDARQQVDVQMTQEGNQITIWVNRLEYGIVFGIHKGSRVDFEIRVPLETSLQLLISSGDLDVSDVTGAMALETSFGSVQVEDASGELRAKSGTGDITLIGLGNGGDAEIETSFGKLILEDITADSLVARSDSGDIQMAGGALDGLLNLETSFGKVTVEGVDASSYQLKSDSGGLTLNGCGGFLDLHTNFGDIEVQNAIDAALTLKASSGKVFFSGSLSDEGEHQAESEFGDVHLILPAGTAFDLDAETEFGSVETDFSVTVTKFETTHLVGGVNGGGPLLRLRTDSGDVILESVTSESD
ncbi:MAG: DUF4097 domain-containing protein [Chloroflexi bacterium]|nr:DUF4097 domain-containing protein [Chloroflexota bacterium]